MHNTGPLALRDAGACSVLRRMGLGSMCPWVALQISVVVPTLGVCEQLAATLACLEAQVIDPIRVQVVVVSDGSEGVGEIVENWNPPFRHRALRTRPEEGLAAAFNRGWQEAAGDVVVFLGCGTLVHPQFLVSYCRHFETSGAEVVSGRRWHVNLAQVDPQRGAQLDRLTTGSGRCMAEAFTAMLSSARLGQGPGHAAARLEREIAEVCDRYPTALTRALAFVAPNVGVSRRLLESTRGLSGFAPGVETLDLGVRLALCGAKFRVAPDVHSLQLFRPAQEPRRALEDEFRATILRHPLFQLIAWQGWAAQHPSLASLAEIARAECESSFDVRALLDMGRHFGLPQSVWMTDQEFLGLYARRSGVAEHQLAQRLKQARARGVIHRSEGGIIRYDHDLLVHWLQQQDDLAQACESHRPSPCVSADAPRRPECSRPWVGQYEVVIERAALPQSQNVVVNLALPLSTPESGTIAITEWAPKDLGEYCRRGMVIGYPVRPGTTGQIRLGYTFRCGEGADVPMLRAGAERSDQPTRFLTPCFPAKELPHLRRLLHSFLPEPWPRVTERIETIRSWLLLGPASHRTSAASYVLARSGSALGGQLVELFVALCQLSGVPARARSAAQLPRTDSGESVGFRCPFFPSGAEVWFAETGWQMVLLPPPPWFSPVEPSKQNLENDGASIVYGSELAGLLPTIAVWNSGWHAVEPASSTIHRLRGGPEVGSRALLASS